LRRKSFLRGILRIALAGEPERLERADYLHSAYQAKRPFSRYFWPSGLYGCKSAYHAGDATPGSGAHFTRHG